MRPRRVLIGLAVILGFVVGSPGIAVAKTTATPGYSFISGNADCGWTEAWLTDQGASPGLQSVGTTDYFNGSTCGDNTFVPQVFRMALKENLMRWDGTGWVLCQTNAPFIYNNGQSHDVWTGFNWGAPPCGHAYYRSWSQVWTQTNFGSSWHSDAAILGNDWIIL